nr:hypothetical protein [Streptomyces sp. S1D4-11]
MVETAVHGHLVVDRCPFLLAQRRVHGHREPYFGVGVHRERTAFGGSEVGAVRDALPHLRVRIGGQQDHHVGGEAGVVGDHRPLVVTGRSGQDKVHDGSGEGQVLHSMPVRP